MLSMETNDARIRTRTDTISHSVIREVNIIWSNNVMVLKLHIQRSWPGTS